MLFAIAAISSFTLQGVDLARRCPDRIERPAVVPVRRHFTGHPIFTEIEQESFEDSSELDGEPETVLGLSIIIPMDQPCVARSATSLAMARLLTHTPLFLELRHFRC